MDLVKQNQLLKERVDALEEMYKKDVSNLMAENEQLKERLSIATGGASTATTPAQIRHV